MALVYDLPTEQLGAGYSAPTVQNQAPRTMQQSGQAMMTAGNTVSRIMEDYQNMIDDAAVKEADNALSEVIRTTLHNPESGYLTMQGKAAIDGRETAIKAISENYEKITPNLKNDLQKKMFSQVSRQRIQAAMSQIDQHTVAQSKAYSASEARARLDGAINDASMNWAGWKQDGSLFKSNKAIIDSEIRSMAQLAGIPENSAQIKKARVDAMTQLHSNVILNMFSMGLTDEAKEYFNDALKAGEISADKADDFRTRLKVASTATKADNLAEQVFNELLPKDPNGALSIFKMEKRARELAGDDEDLQQKAVAGIRERASAFNAEQAEFKAQNTSAVWKMIDSGTSIKKIQLSPEWLGLTGSEQHQILGRVEDERNARSNRLLADVTRAEKELFLKNADEYLTVTDPAVLSKMSRGQVEALRGKFGIEKTEYLLRKYDEILKPGKLAEAKMDSDQFNTIAIDMGLDPYSRNQKERKKIGYFRDQVETLIDIEQRSNKRILTREEKQALINKSLAKIVMIDVPLWPDYEKPAMLVTPDQVKRVVIPPDKRQSLIDAMKTMYQRTGNKIYEPTETNIRRQYLIHINPAAAGMGVD